MVVVLLAVFFVDLVVSIDIVVNGRLSDVSESSTMKLLPNAIMSKYGI